MIFFVIFTILVYAVNTVMVIFAIKEGVMGVALSIVSLLLPFVFTIVFVWGMIDVHRSYLLEYLNNVEGRLDNDGDITFVRKHSDTESLP